MFIRKYKLIFGSTFKLTSAVYDGVKFKKQTDLSTYTAQHAKNSQYVLTNHHIEFDFTFDDSKHPNSGTISVYNMSDTLVDYLKNNVDHNVIVTLLGGYEDTTLNTVFEGTLEAIEDRWDTVDRTTKMIFGDGSTNLLQAHTSKTYPKGTPIKTIMMDTAKEIGLPIGNVSTLAETAVVDKPLSVMGKSKDVLSNLAESYDYDWHIQNGKINILKKNKLTSSTVHRITPDSGLLGSPYYKTTFKKKKKKEGGGVEKQEALTFDCLLNAAIVVGSTVYIKSRYYDGTFKVHKVTHSGSYMSTGDWKTTIECHPTQDSTKK